MEPPDAMTCPEITLRPIGFIRSPIAERDKGPCMGSEGGIIGDLVIDECYREIVEHPIPTEMDAVRLLSSAPATLDLFVWLSYRSC